MEIAILVFFIAIFGGVLFLLGLIWFIFRRIKNARSSSRNFAGSSNRAGGSDQPLQHFSDSDDRAGALYAASRSFDVQEPESAGKAFETASDNPQPDFYGSAHESRGESGAAAADYGYSESSYSGSDAGSDSGSSSGDSGSSSSSSD